MKTTRVQSKREEANIIERESSENILQVQNDVVPTLSQNRNQPILNLRRHNLKSIAFHGGATELQASHLSLKPPRITINVENPPAKKIAEDHRERLSFGVVIKPGLENILNVFRVRGQDIPEDMNLNRSGQ